MKLYHGSNMAVEKPEIRKPTHGLDFGGGLYTTHNFEQAEEFAEKVVRRLAKAVAPVGVPTVSEYDFDIETAEKTLKILRFEKPDAEWLKFVVDNRKNIHKESEYDLVIGPVANDDVYKTIKVFENGIYTAEETIRRLKVKELFSQTLIKTDAALALLKFVKSTIIRVKGVL